MLPTAVSIFSLDCLSLRWSCSSAWESDVARLQFRCRTAELTLLSALVLYRLPPNDHCPICWFLDQPLASYVASLTALGCAAGL